MYTDFYCTIPLIVDFPTPYFSDSILSVGLGNISDSLISLSSRDDSTRLRLEGGSEIYSLNYLNCEFEYLYEYLNAIASRTLLITIVQ